MEKNSHVYIGSYFPKLINICSSVIKGVGPLILAITVFGVIMELETYIMGNINSLHLPTFFVYNFDHKINLISRHEKMS